MPYLADTNQLGDVTHTARPDLVPGVPLVNPLWDRNCPDRHRLPAICQSVGLHAAGAGRAGHRAAHARWRPRTVVAILQRSMQKNFSLGEKRQAVQFRVDALNVVQSPGIRGVPE